MIHPSSADLINGMWEIKDTAGGKGMCHRAQFVVIPQTLGKFLVSRPPCTGASCTLWDSELNHCRDVSTAKWIVEIAKSLDALVQCADVLCHHAGEK